METGNPAPRPWLYGIYDKKQIRFVDSDFFWGGITEETNGFRYAEKLGATNHREERKMVREKIQTMINQHMEGGRFWIERRFSSHAVQSIFLYNKDLVIKWVEAVLNDENSSQSILNKARSFYEILCQELLKIDTILGVSLYEKLQEDEPTIHFLHKDTHIPILQYALFQAQYNPETLNAWDKSIDECKSDLDLMKLAVVALNGTGDKWLRIKVENDLLSPVQFIRARAVTLWGIMAPEEAGIWLKSKRKSESEVWFDRVVENSLMYYNTKKWTEHWFRRFTQEKDDTKSWAAFRLLLKCVDIRFWNLWEESSKERNLSNNECYHRYYFLESNINFIRNAVNKNQEDMTKKFLANKVLHNEAWPWMKTV